MASTTTHQDQLANDEHVVNKGNNRNRIIQLIIDLIVIVILFVVYGIVYGTVDPKIRYIHCSDTEIFFPHLPDTIPYYAVALYGTIAPILVIIIVELSNAKLLPFQNSSELGMTKRDVLKKFVICTFHGVSLFVLGISITVLLTEIGKKWIGRLRPHFIAVCKPDFSQYSCTTQIGPNQIENYIYTGDGFCTGFWNEVKNARQSFPSGHASYSFYTMMFIIYYLHARLVLYKFRFVKPLVQLTAFIAAFVTCISRVGDYAHRGSDVIGGAILGILIAVFICRVFGKILWHYGVETDYYDFELKPKRNRT